MRLGAEKIATGHYARVRELKTQGNGGKSQFQLLKGLDDTKDRRYFLHRLNQAQLSKTLFPWASFARAGCSTLLRRSARSRTSAAA